MQINTSFLLKCVNTVTHAYNLLNQTSKDNIEYEMYRSACIKEFEIILEQIGKLLKKTLKPYFSSGKPVDKLFFKDIFREAALRKLITPEESERWLTYRDLRNSTAHDYGEEFAESILIYIPNFINDCKRIIEVIESENNKENAT